MPIRGSLYHVHLNQVHSKILVKLSLTPLVLFDNLLLSFIAVEVKLYRNARKQKNFQSKNVTMCWQNWSLSSAVSHLLIMILYCTLVNVVCVLRHFLEALGNNPERETEISLLVPIHHFTHSINHLSVFIQLLYRSLVFSTARTNWPVTWSFRISWTCRANVVVQLYFYTVVYKPGRITCAM